MLYIMYNATIEERTSSEDECVGYIRIGFLTARIKHDVSLNSCLDQVPLSISNIVAQISAVTIVQQIQLGINLTNAMGAFKPSLDRVIRGPEKNKNKEMEEDT